MFPLFRPASFTAAALFWAAACGVPSGPGLPPHAVLFIGNSLTYTNDLARTIADLAPGAASVALSGNRPRITC